MDTCTLPAFREGVPDADGPVVVDADDVAGVGRLHVLAVRGHEGQRVGDLHVPPDAHVTHFRALGERPGTDAQEGDAVAVVRVHVRLDLEHETGERGLGRIHRARLRRPRQRRRRVRHEVVQQFLHAEVVDRRPGIKRKRYTVAGKQTRNAPP